VVSSSCYILSQHGGNVLENIPKICKEQDIPLTTFKKKLNKRNYIDMLESMNNSERLVRGVDITTPP
jgi:hypothetical protein